MRRWACLLRAAPRAPRLNATAAAVSPHPALPSHWTQWQSPSGDGTGVAVAAAAAARRGMAAAAGSRITVTFVEPDGEEYEVEANIGDHFLDVAHDNDIELEGACGGELACSTCHVILEQAFFDKLEEPDEEEEDMLDLALGLTDTSRLACQVCATPELDGMRLIIPEETADMR